MAEPAEDKSRAIIFQDEDGQLYKIASSLFRVGDVTGAA
jgi:hypothetical protein